MGNFTNEQARRLNRLGIVVGAIDKGMWMADNGMVCAAMTFPMLDKTIKNVKVEAQSGTMALNALAVALGLPSDAERYTNDDPRLNTRPKRLNLYGVFPKEGGSAVAFYRADMELVALLQHVSTTADVTVADHFEARQVA